MNTIIFNQPLAQPAYDLDMNLKNFIKKFFEYYNLKFNYDNIKNIYDGETIDSYLQQNIHLDIILSKKPRITIENIGIYHLFYDICNNLGIHPI